ncbi:MAG TPA: sensor domain-containing diguanylate cyclase [Acidimicrobiales bacterium]|nr:sensor domain-containing diguanylate cyclase [Acidimicrobiales bacterium]
MVTPHDESRASWLLVLAPAVAVALACFVTTGGTAERLTLLYVLPIGLAASRSGRRAGVAAAVMGLALSGVWAATSHAQLGAVGWLTQASAFLVAGAVVGSPTGERRSPGAADTRWFEMSNDMLVEASLDGYFTRLSERWETCLGWTREELMSRPFREFIHPDDLASTMSIAGSLDARPGEVVNFENRYQAKDGSWRWLLWCARSDEHRKYAVARDISDRKRLEQERLELLGRVEAMARTDALTGLPNRRSWDEEVGHAIARARRHGSPLALAMLDLDHFKSFNDTFGHAAGDALLANAASAWHRILRTTDFLARYGGEEFALLLPGCARDESITLLERLRASTPQDQTCSVGIAYWDPSEPAETLVARADAALYEAKGRGRDRVVASR